MGGLHVSTTLLETNEVTDTNGQALKVGDVVVFAPGSYNARGQIRKITFEGVPGTDGAWFVSFPGFHVLASNCQRVSK